MTQLLTGTRGEQQREAGTDQNAGSEQDDARHELGLVASTLVQPENPDDLLG
jgi:hypothetical protein